MKYCLLDTVVSFTIVSFNLLCSLTEVLMEEMSVAIALSP